MKSFGKCMTGPFVVFAGLVLGLASACGGEDDEGTGSPLAEENFLLEVAKAYCDAGADCCAAGGLPVNQRCVEVQVEALGKRVKQMREELGRTEYDEEEARTCLTLVKIQKGQCRTDLDLLLFWGQGSDSCEGVYHRPRVVEPGQPCEEAGECVRPAESVATCNYDDNHQRTCRIGQRVRDGAPCGMTNLPGVSHICGEDSWCDTTVPVCKPLPGEGESCEMMNCRPGLKCDGQASYGVVCTQGLLGVRADCTGDDQCESELCDADLKVCLPASGGKEDAPCEWGFDCLSQECEYDELSKRNECKALDPYVAGMVNAKTCNTEVDPTADR